MYILIKKVVEYHSVYSGWRSDYEEKHFSEKCFEELLQSSSAPCYVWGKIPSLQEILEGTEEILFHQIGGTIFTVYLKGRRSFDLEYQPRWDNPIWEWVNIDPEWSVFDEEEE